jgi:CheY-like chemotaxis protein
MEPAVTHVVRRSSSSSLSDAPFGSCPSRAALRPASIAPSVGASLRGGTAQSNAHPIAAKPSEPVPATRISLDSERNRQHQQFDSSQDLGPERDARVKPRTAHSILVVEDDPDITMALQDLLEFEGFQVDCVRTCRQAFSSIEQNAYHAVLLDLGLPDGDGCSILEKLQVSNPSLPVIVLTAAHRNLGSLRAYARLTKPWERRELCQLLRRAIGTKMPSTVR